MWAGVGDPTWDKDRFDRAVASAGQLTHRVEVWSDTTQLTDAAPVEDGSVTDEWVTAGPRRKLTMTAPPTRDWLRWLGYPSLEIRPYLGLRISRTVTMECPMGRYPLDPPEMTLPSSLITIQADDYGIYLSDADFTDKPNQRPAGRITSAIGALIKGAGLPEPTVTASSTAQSGTVTVDATRLDAIADAARSVSAEVWADRLGQMTIADAAVLGSATSTILTGTGGTAAGVNVKPDLADLFNVVSATSSAQGIVFPAQIASLGWSGHPAHPYKLGSITRPRRKVFHYASPLLMDAAQALAAANTILARKAALAGQVTYQAFPDPSRDAGDTVEGALIEGTQLAQLKTVVHPFRAAYSTVTTVPTMLVAS